MAGPTGKTFKLNLSKWRKKLDGKLDGLARQVSQAIAYRVVTLNMERALDTGFLAGSWQPSIGEPKVRMSPTADKSAGPVMADIALICAGMKAGDIFYMTNGAAYARRMEYGFVGPDSLGRVYNQAGRHFVRDGVAAAPEIVKQVAAELAG